MIPNVSEAYSLSACRNRKAVFCGFYRQIKPYPETWLYLQRQSVLLEKIRSLEKSDCQFNLTEMLFCKFRAIVISSRPALEGCVGAARILLGSRVVNRIDIHREYRGILLDQHFFSLDQVILALGSI